MTDRDYMKQAMMLALKGRGTTSPNPVVGALVVKNGRIVGNGYHKKAGGPHAEVFALNEAKENARRATLYVTLEPCSHFGRTAPCLDRILESGIGRVVIGMKDPNPVNNGKSIRCMRAAGIEVRVGILEKELQEINRPFFKYIIQRMPFVTVKVGQSLDGKIATRTGDSQWITSESSRRYAHRLRRFYDAILVGINTVLRDNPKLTNPYSERQPYKIIVDTKLRIPLRAAVLRNPQRVIIAAGTRYPQKKLTVLQKRGVVVLSVHTRDGKIRLGPLFKELARREITNILVEGGGSIIGSLFDEALVDKVLFFIAPKIIGGGAAISSVEGKGARLLKGVFFLDDVTVKNIGNDIMVEGYVHRNH